MLGTVLNLLFPPQCLACRARVTSNGTLCLDCWKQVRFISAPLCTRCGEPFEFALGDGAVCGECMRSEPSFAKARAAFRYDEHSRQLVTSFKYGDQTQLAPIYGAWLERAGKELIEASEVIVPVPLSYWRFISRRYNQSAILAHALAKKTGLPVLPDGLRRTRHTQAQAGLTRKQRQDNVRGAFAIGRRRQDRIRGKSVLLIDDVMTTRATIDECSKALLKGGAASVNVLTLAKTIY